MIKFEIADTAKTLDSLKAWADVMNEHIDEVNDEKENVGIWYNHLHYGKAGDKPSIVSVIIWDAETKKIWRIYDTDGNVQYDTEKANNLIQYSLQQWAKLFEKRTGIEWMAGYNW